MFTTVPVLYQCSGVYFDALVNYTVSGLAEADWLNSHWAFVSNILLLSLRLVALKQAEQDGNAA